jgi:hypothetical protein
MSEDEMGSRIVPIPMEVPAQPKPSPPSGLAERSAEFIFHFRWSRIFTKRIPLAGAKESSTVLVSITEVDRLDPTGKPFIGAATMKIYNVAPGQDPHTHQGFVDVRGEIDWSSDLNIRLNIFLV